MVLGTKFMLMVIIPYQCPFSFVLTTKLYGHDAIVSHSTVLLQLQRLGTLVTAAGGLKSWQDTQQTLLNGR